MLRGFRGETMHLNRARKGRGGGEFGPSCDQHLVSELQEGEEAERETGDKGDLDGVWGSVEGESTRVFLIKGSLFLSVLMSPMIKALLRWGLKVSWLFVLFCFSCFLSSAEGKDE